jgi:hypothetical protein
VRAATKGTGEIVFKDWAVRTWREAGACVTDRILIVGCLP